MKNIVAAIALFFVSAASFTAQQKSADPSLGTTSVSGRVFCGDTNTPARMASVILEPADIIDSITPGEQHQANFSGEAVETLLDGSFVIHNVAPGRYYVIASKQGYVYPTAKLYIGAADRSVPADSQKQIPVTAPRITVQANLPVAVNVTIERGGAISGTVLYDDGSPASGIILSVLAHVKDQWVKPPTSPTGQSSFSGGTNDEGHYRISGLPAGEYLVEANLHLSKTVYRSDEHSGTSVSMESVYSLSVYTGGSTRRKDASSFSLKIGEERNGMDLEIPLTKLHSIRGEIIAKHDGHVLNGGKLSLLYADDKSVVAHSAVTEEDDSFGFSFVPEGDYILRVDEASDNEYRRIRNAPGSFPPTSIETRTLRNYGSAEQAIHVSGEVTGLVVAVPDQTQKPQPTL